MNKLICILLFFLTTANIKAQDTLCYKEISRYEKVDKFLSTNMVSSYIHNWLFFLDKNDSDKDEVELSIYKQNDTLTYNLYKDERHSTIATDDNGNPVLIVHENSRRMGIKKLIFFDSTLKVIEKVVVKKSILYDYESTFYDNIRYVRKKKNEILLMTSPASFVILYSITLDKLVLSESSIDKEPYLYDWGWDKRDNVKTNDPKAFCVNEGRIYYYQSHNSVTKERGHIIGNISPNYINRSTLFIKGGFVTQLDNKDIVFFKFCD